MIGGSLMFRCSRAAAGAEFAMVLPLLVLFLLGVIDVGRYMWTVNQLEKATQVGARTAVVTTMVPTDLASTNFAGNLGQGASIPSSSFGAMQCTSNGTTASCSCISNCSGIGTTANNAAFNLVADRVSFISGIVARNNVMIRYDNSGLGYAGDPNGPDVAPVVTVSVINVNFESVVGFDFALPAVSASLTLEDGQGSFSN